MTTVILDNGVEYFIIDTLEMNGTIYTLFSSVEDEMNYCFRKTTVKDNVKYFSGLDDREEFNKVLLAFAEKMNNK